MWLSQKGLLSCEPRRRISKPGPGIPGAEQPASIRSVITPVYVASEQDTALINVLVAGIPVDAELGQELKASTGGSDFVFLVNGKVAAATLDPRAQREIESGRGPDGRTQQVTLAGTDYFQFSSTLTDVQKNPVGELVILRSLAASQTRIAEMRSRLVKLWIGAMLAGIGLTICWRGGCCGPWEDIEPRGR